VELIRAVIDALGGRLEAWPSGRPGGAALAATWLVEIRGLEAREVALITGTPLSEWDERLAGWRAALGRRVDLEAERDLDGRLDEAEAALLSAREERDPVVAERRRAVEEERGAFAAIEAERRGRAPEAPDPEALRDLLAGLAAARPSRHRWALLYPGIALLIFGGLVALSRCRSGAPPVEELSRSLAEATRTVQELRLEPGPALGALGEFLARQGAAAELCLHVDGEGNFHASASLSAVPLGEEQELHFGRRGDEAWTWRTGGERVERRDLAELEDAFARTPRRALAAWRRVLALARDPAAERMKVLGHQSPDGEDRFWWKVVSEGTRASDRLVLWYDDDRVLRRLEIGGFAFSVTPRPDLDPTVFLPSAWVPPEVLDR
ncbi:MAG: hypothetical protein R3F20_06560, partial [Planctomycetota bacterium]